MTGAIRRCAVWALLTLGLAASPAGAEERVQVTGDSAGGKAIVNFDWATPTTFSAEIFDGNLIVRFGRPFEASFDEAVKALPRHLLDATIRPDQRTAVLALRREQTFRSSQSGNRVSIELLDPGSAKVEANGTPKPPALRPPKPQSANAEPAQLEPAKPVLAKSEPAKSGPAKSGPAKSEPAKPEPKPAEAAPAGPRVRLGSSEDGTRLEIDWGRPVAVATIENGRAVTMTFDAPGKLDLGDLKDRALKLVDGIDSKADRTTSSLSLTLAERARLRQSQDGNRHIIDIAPATGPRTAAKQETKPETKAESKPEARAEAKSEPKPEAKPEAKAEAKPNGKGEAKPSAPPAAATNAPPGGEADTPTRLTPAAPATANGPLAVSTQLVDDRLTLRFPWTQPVAAAAFRRGEQIWIVFDRPAKLELARVLKAPATVMTGAAQLADEAATVLRMNASASINPALSLDGTTWNVELRHQPLQPETPIAIEPRSAPSRETSLALIVDQPGNPVRLRDPDVGDRLVVVPIANPGQGVAGTREFAEFRILASSQGIAIEPIADRIAVEAAPGAVVVSAPGGLLMSSNSDSAFGAGAFSGPRLLAEQPLFDFPAWSRGGEAKFSENRRALNLLLANAPPETRTAVRLENARFYFANLMPQDALGALERIEADGDPEAVSAEFRALKGAALTMSRRGADAEAVLADPRLQDNREAQLWRAAAAAQRGNFTQANALFVAAGAVPQTYPALLRQDLGLKATEAAIAAGDPKLGSSLADALGGLIKDGPNRGQLDYLRGRALADLGKRADAVKLWTEVVARRELPSWPRAEMALIESGLAAKTLKPLAAIERLEKLRYVWRGDELERRVLSLLAQLNLEVGNSAAGLSTYRELASTFPDSAEARGAADAMTKAFTKLFVDGESESMPPLKALALYDQFRELTPSGAKGDAVIRNLADRLASIDLLDRASELLEDLVKNRLTGDAKAEGGARLAAIRLQNGQPAAAIEALDASNVETVSDPLKRERARTRAQALVQLDKPEEALALIAADDGDPADRLRQDIYWKQADWPQAAKVAARRAERLAPAGGKPEKPSAEAATAIMNAAVATSLAGDKKALAALRERYAKAMDQTAQRSAFRLIANGSGSPTDLAQVRQSLETAQGFQQFLNSTRPAAGGAAPPPAPGAPAPKPETPKPLN
ncbi:MAG: hypothetical protein IT562_01465 [Alphaproteobacteria bacterium]|nr:hypothetical protein [Alphaproteobacteria bacterium]